MGHPACDFARQMMLVSLAGTGVHLSDGATNILPVGPHRARPGQELQPRNSRKTAKSFTQRGGSASTTTCIRCAPAFTRAGTCIRRSSSLVTRRSINFFLEGLESASNRLKTFVEKAALASLFGDVFDDAATGQGLLNFFLRGIACGAITEEEALATGLTIEEIRSRSFYKILEGRRKK